MIVLEPIGYVRNRHRESQLPELIKRDISRIEILPEYAEGLTKIEEQQYLDLIFVFHREERTELTTRIRSGETVGIFSSRSPKRPNHLGVTTVRLLKSEGHILWVEGADALDGSPVVDIKCCDTSLFDREQIHQAIQAGFPRADVIRHLLEGNASALLLQAARLHGHICPGLALGVMAAVEVVRRILEAGGDIREYVLTVEMRHCPVDGVLFVTGCTPGGNRFLFGDPEKNRFSLRNREGKGWAVEFLPSARKHLETHLPAHLSGIEKGLKTLDLDPERLFRVLKVG